MTKNTWMSVPAGALGLGSADARPFGGVAVRAAAQPPLAVRQGSGLPAARLRDVADGTGAAVLGTAPTGIACTEFIAQHDGTTLGFHTSSRPLS